ncbi:MAG TPA: hypothetical protein ENI80_11920 [Acidiferrobacteraceae bacterium]|nr:hypothetical protein [Acidiferrobacteraceae bacterium]
MTLPNLSLGLVIGLLVVSAPLAAQTRTLATQPLFQPLLLAADDYAEGWEHFIRFDDGSLLVSHFMISSMGPGNHRGIMVATFTTPDGHTYVIKNGRKRKQWEGVSGPNRIGIAKHYVEGSGHKYRIHLKNNTAEIDINFNAIGTPWQGNRVSLSEPDGEIYQDLMFYAPYLTATGRYRPGKDSGGGGNESWRLLTGGQGFALRYVTSTGIYKLATDRLRLTTLGSESHRLTADLIKTTDGQWRPRMALWVNGRVRHQFGAVNIEPVWPNDGQSHPKDIPQSFTLSATAGDYQLTGTLHLNPLLHRFDVLANMGILDRLFIGAFSAPVQSRYRANYQLRLSHNGGSQTLDGRALVEYVQINPR